MGCHGRPYSNYGFGTRKNTLRTREQWETMGDHIQSSNYGFGTRKNTLRTREHWETMGNHTQTMDFELGRLRSGLGDNGIPWETTQTTDLELRRVRSRVRTRRQRGTMGAHAQTTDLELGKVHSGLGDHGRPWETTQTP